MRRSILSVAVIVFVVGLACTAGAYDFLYFNDSPMTHDAGTFGVSAGFVYFSQNGWYDNDGEKVDFEGDMAGTEMYAPVDIYYSIMDQLEIGIKPAFQMNTWTDLDGDEFDSNGIMDTWIDAKYMIMMDPMVTARAGLKVATGDDEGDEDNGPTGTGQMDIDAAVLFGMPAGPGQFGAQVGYRMGLEDDDGCAPGGKIMFLVDYHYPLSDVMQLKVAADGYFGSDNTVDGDAVEDSGSNAVEINPGITYSMDNGMDVGFDVFYVLMGTNEAAKWGAGLCVGWGTQ
jgi:hypothetical protein